MPLKQQEHKASSSRLFVVTCISEGVISDAHK